MARIVFGKITKIDYGLVTIIRDVVKGRHKGPVSSPNDRTSMGFGGFVLVR